MEVSWLEWSRMELVGRTPKRQAGHRKPIRETSLFQERPSLRSGVGSWKGNPVFLELVALSRLPQERRRPLPLPPLPLLKFAIGISNFPIVFFRQQDSLIVHLSQLSVRVQNYLKESQTVHNIILIGAAGRIEPQELI